MRRRLPVLLLAWPLCSCAAAENDGGAPPLLIEGFRNHTPEIRLTVNGRKEGLFLFDTGADSAITQDLLSNLGLAEGDTSQVTAPTSVVGTKGAHGVTLSSAGHLVSSGEALVVPSGGIGGDAAVKGAIGLDYLKGAIVVFDYANRRIRKISENEYSLPKECSVVDMKYYRPIIVQAAINGVSGDFMIDSGAEGFVYLYETFWAAHPEVFSARGKAFVEVARGLDGPVGGGREEGGTLTLGDYRADLPEITLIGGEPGGALAGRLSGIIGAPLFEAFKVTLDSIGRRMILEPATPASR